MTSHDCFKWMQQLMFLLVVSTGVWAQDPYGGSSAQGTSGVLGVPLHETGPDIERVSSRAGNGKQLEFKSETSLVQVPVIVTDASGNHIHQLTQADFKVLEDGKPQRIASFEEVVPVNRIATTTPPKTGDTFTNLAPDGGAARSITVMVLDEVNTPFLSQSYARGQLIKYLANHLDSSQPLGLMAIGSKGLIVLSGLDSDPATLIAALKKASGTVTEMERFSKDGQALAASGDPPSGLTRGIGRNESPEHVIQKFILRQDGVEATNSQAHAIEATLRAFITLAWSLSGMPGRKSVVWVTGSFPFYLDSFTAVPGDPTLRVLYERALTALNDAEISVYPVDARGLLSDPTYAGDTAGSMLGSDAPDLLNQSTITSLKTFAKMTGGVAYYSSNDLVGAFSRAVQDSSSYYLLTYYLDRRNTKPGWRQLQVQVSRKDTEVRARSGYLVTNIAVNPELTHKADVNFALSSPFESTGVRITERWLGALPAGNKKKVGFALQVPAEDLISEADKNRFDVEFVAQATNKGVTAGTVGQTIKGAASPDSLAKLKADGIFYKNTLDLSPGDYEVWFVVRDNLSGRMGSVIVPLTVN